MVCPFCLHEKTAVYNSRQTSRVNITWRRRCCLECGRKFTTSETIDCQKILKVVSNDSKKPVSFSRSRLLLSILKASDHHSHSDEVAYTLCETIEQKLLLKADRNNGHVTKQLIIQTCLATLKNFDAAAYLKYLANHGPALDMRSLKQHLRTSR
ncbi:MAG TPA: hypothetical protein VNX65_03925 [Patescibacteria group bacterium]|jgi:transcriptional repressor NrdR|nr:hypothetical protein [Patescibacteria group bacterium]